MVTARQLNAEDISDFQPPTPPAKPAGNKWIYAGVGVAVLGLAYLYYKSKSTAAATTAASPVASTTPVDESLAASEPETGLNVGNSSGYNGYNAGVGSLCNCPVIPAGYSTTPGPAPCNCPIPVTPTPTAITPAASTLNQPGVGGTFTGPGGTTQTLTAADVAAGNAALANAGNTNPSTAQQAFAQGLAQDASIGVNPFAFSGPL